MVGFLRTILLTTLTLVFLSAFPSYADVDLSPPTGVSLKYEEVRPGTETKCGGGGILGAIDCVAIRIEGAGADGNVTSIASLGLTLNPVLRPEDNYSVVKVYVRVEGGIPTLTEHFENQPQVEADARSDTRLVKERLKRWTTNLNQDEIEELLNTGQTEVEISRPFEGLKILELEKPPAILTLIMPVAGGKLEVRFTDDEFNEIDEALILVPELAGSGTGEVWVEVEVPADHPDFDDGMVEVLKVQVTSDIDPEGEVVVCVETAPDSRIFRSQKAIEISIQMGIES